MYGIAVGHGPTGHIFASMGRERASELVDVLPGRAEQVLGRFATA